jgi:hypothetical protein
MVNRIVYLMFFTIVWYNALDVYNTYWAMEIGVPEGNPIYYYPMLWWGRLPGLIILKLILMSLLGIGLCTLLRRRSRSNLKKCMVNK